MAELEGQNSDESCPDAPLFGSERSFVVFCVGQAWFAVEALATDQLAVMQPLTPVPCAPRHIAGLANVKGRITPVLDLGRFLGLAAPSLRAETDADRNLFARILVVASGRMRVGILSDRVSGLARLPAHALSPPDAVLGDRTRAFAQAQFDDRAATPGGGSRLVVLLDLPRLLEAARIQRVPA
jgi:purine-binding chemotaxis protein CheW